MGNAIIMGSGKTPPPNSVEIEITAAEDIKAGEFVGFEIQEMTAEDYQDYTGPINPSSSGYVGVLYYLKSSQGIDGKYLMTLSGSNSSNTIVCMAQIYEDGTVEQGASTITIAKGRGVNSALRFDDYLVVMTSANAILSVYKMDGLELTLVSTIQLEASGYCQSVGMYDIENNIFAVNTANKLYFIRYNDGGITKLYEESVSNSSPRACGTKKTKNGYEIRVVLYSGTIWFYTCDENFQNWTKQSGATAIATYVRGGIFANDIFYVIAGAADSAMNVHKYKLMEDKSITQVGSATLAKYSNTKCLIVGEIVEMEKGANGTSNISGYYLKFLKKNNTSEYPQINLARASSSTTCVFYHTSDTSGIMISSGPKLKSTSAIIVAKKSDVELTGIAKTSAKNGGKLKIWISKGMSKSYYIS